MVSAVVLQRAHEWFGDVILTNHIRKLAGAISAIERK
jgi:hypothetical protein